MIEKDVSLFAMKRFFSLFGICIVSTEDDSSKKQLQKQNSHFEAHQLDARFLIHLRSSKMQARLWNIENGKSINMDFAKDPNSWGYYEESDGTKSGRLFFLEMSSLFYYSNHYNSDCFVRDFTEKCYYLVTTEYEKEKDTLHYLVFFFPINGWTDTDAFRDYLRDNRDFFREYFRLFYRYKNEKVKKIIDKLEPSKRFLNKFRSEKLVSLEEYERNTKAIEEESKCHFAVTLPRPVAC